MRELTQNEIQAVTGGDPTNVACTPWISLSANDSVRGCLTYDKDTKAIGVSLEGQFHDLEQFLDSAINALGVFFNDVATAIGDAVSAVADAVSDFFNRLFGNDKTPGDSNTNGLRASVESAVG